MRAPPERRDQRVVGTASPAPLLREVVRERRWSLADGDEVWGVYGAPAVARLRVAARVQSEARRHVLRDRVAQTANRFQRGDADRVVRADEHRRRAAVAGAL